MRAGARGRARAVRLRRNADARAVRLLRACGGGRERPAAPRSSERAHAATRCTAPSSGAVITLGAGRSDRSRSARRAEAPPPAPSSARDAHCRSACRRSRSPWESPRDRARYTVLLTTSRPRGARLGQHLAKIREHARGLLDDAAVDDLPRDGIERDLPCSEQKATRDDRLRIRADRCGGCLSLDSLVRHASPFQ